MRRCYSGPVWLVGSSLLSSCALFGYDFDAYGPAPAERSTSGGDSGEPRASDPGVGGRPALRPKIAETGGDDSSEGGRSSPPEAAEAGEPGEGGSAGCVDGSAGTWNAGGAAIEIACEPATCSAQLKPCGPATDGCGHPLDCGQCFWWFEVCTENQCVIAQ